MKRPFTGTAIQFSRAERASPAHPLIHAHTPAYAPAPTHADLRTLGHASAKASTHTPLRAHARAGRAAPGLELVLFAEGAPDLALAAELEIQLERAYETPGVRELLQTPAVTMVYDPHGRIRVFGELLPGLPSPFHALYNLHSLIERTSRSQDRATPLELEVFRRVIRDGAATEADLRILSTLIERLRIPFAEQMHTLMQSRTPAHHGISLPNPWGRLAETRFEMRHLREVQGFLSTPHSYISAWILWHLAVRMTLSVAALDPRLYTTGWVIKRNVLGIHVIEVDLTRSISINPLAFLERSARAPSSLAAWLATVAAHEVTHAMTFSAHAKHGEQFASARERVGELAGMVSPVLARLITRLLPLNSAHQDDPAWLLERAEQRREHLQQDIRNTRERELLLEAELSACQSGQAKLSQVNNSSSSDSSMAGPEELLDQILREWLHTPPPGHSVEMIRDFWQRHREDLTGIIESLLQARPEDRVVSQTRSFKFN